MTSSQKNTIPSALSTERSTREASVDLSASTLFPLSLTEFKKIEPGENKETETETMSSSRNAFLVRKESKYIPNLF